jgi:hypothetical protein
MKKIKKKSSVVSSEKPASQPEAKKDTGSKFKSTSVKAVKESLEQEKAPRKEGSKGNFLKLKEGRSFWWILPPVSDGMNGLPFYKRLMHNGMGPEGKGWGPCMRKNNAEARANCDGCVDCGKLWDLIKNYEKSGVASQIEKAKDLRPKAKKMIARERPVVQVIDVSGAYDKAGRVVEQFPTCFGDNFNKEEDTHDKCRKCSFSDSCKAGIRLWEMQFTPYEFILNKIAEEEIDICNPGNAYPLKIIRKGMDERSTYTPELANPIKIPQNVVNFAEENAIDLANHFQVSTKEQMQQMMGVESEKEESSSKSSKVVKSEEEDDIPDFNSETVKKPSVSEDQKTKMRERLKEISSKKKG